MTNSPTPEEHGHLWLGEFVYSTKKQLNADERPAALDNALSQLGRILSSEVTIHHWGEDRFVERTTGIVQSFDLSEGTITLAPDDADTQVVHYCRIEPHEKLGHLVTPTAIISTELEFKL
jgi:hypothetical protein